VSAARALVGIATTAVDSAIRAIETLKADRADLVILVAYMAAEGYTSNDIAYAVEKPWKHADVLADAKAAIEASS
jgi:hypothetical protein